MKGEYKGHSVEHFMAGGSVVKKSKQAQWMAKQRANSLTPARRREISLHALSVRWEKYRRGKALKGQPK